MNGTHFIIFWVNAALLRRHQLHRKKFFCCYSLRRCVGNLAPRGFRDCSLELGCCIDNRHFFFFNAKINVRFDVSSPQLGLESSSGSCSELQLSTDDYEEEYESLVALIA